MAKEAGKAVCRVPEGQGASCCNVEAVVSVDERGQMVLPKEIREKADGLEPEYLNHRLELGRTYLRLKRRDEARRGRLATRDAFERLFARGYLLVGFVREAGRSFQLFEAADLGAVLGRGGVGDTRSGAGGPKDEP